MCNLPTCRSQDPQGCTGCVHKKPDCLQCVHRRQIPGDAHSRCNNVKAVVKGSDCGIHNGWFIWPYSFDPVWLLECNGFSADPKDNLPEHDGDTLGALLAILNKSRSLLISDAGMAPEDSP